MFLRCPGLSCTFFFSLLHQSVVLCDALSSELFQDVVEVSGVREAMARQVGAKLCLMVDLEDEIRDVRLVTANIVCMHHEE